MPEALAETVRAVDTSREQLDGEAERDEQRGEGAVQLVAEPAARAHGDLLDERRHVQHDRHAEVDVEVLERHPHAMRTVQAPQRTRTSAARSPATPILSRYAATDARLERLDRRPRVHDPRV